MKAETYIRLPRWSHYLIAIVLSFLVCGLRIAITPLVGTGNPFLLTSLAVLIAAFIGGLWPGLVSTALTAAFGIWFIVSSEDGAGFGDPGSRILIGAHLAVSLSVSLICGALRSSEIEAAEIAKEEREARDRLDVLVESITDKLIVLTDDLRVLRFNEAAVHRWGLTREHVGQAFGTVLPPSISDALAVPLARALKLQDSVSIEVTDDDTGRYYETRIFPNPDGVLVYFHNITERIMANNAISELAAEQQRVNALLDSLLTHAPLGFAFFDRSHRVERLNDLFAELLRMPGGEVSGKRIEGLSQDFLERIDEVFRTGRAVEHIETTFLAEDADESRSHWHSEFYPVLDQDGETVFVGVVAIDLTERIEVEERLKRSERQFRELADNSPMMIWLCNLDGTAAWFNRPWLEFRNLQMEEAVSEGCFGHIHPDDRPWVEETFREAIQSRESFALEYRSLDRDQKYRWIHMKSNPVFDPDGTLVNFLMSSIDVTDRILMEENLRVSLANEHAARNEAEETNRLRDEFLAGLSHELRTPLTTMLGWTEIMMRPNVAPADLADGLQAIQKSSKLQLQLINDLLDMNRMSVGKIRLEFEFVELTDLVDSAVDMFRSSAKEKNVSLRHSHPNSALVVRADADRFLQIMSNLLSNAIKFTPSGGQIDVGVMKEGSTAKITVSDTGIGIQKEFLPYVFDRFRQADASKSRRHGGLGLGLSIAKQLTDLHGGLIDVSSEVGKGTQFTVALPLVDTSLPESSPRHRQVESGDDDRRRLVDVCILLVEDDLDSREILKRVLESEGAFVIAAGSAPLARKLLKETSPDVVVSDIGLPGEDGFQLMRSIRGATDFGTIPAVALTAFAGSDDRIKAFEAGFNLFLTKPIEPEELVRTVLDLRTRSM